MMKNFANNPVMSALGAIWDLVLLNLCWLICSLPVITAGASSAAMFYCVRKMLNEETWKVQDDFLRVFRDEMKLSIRFWLPLLLFEIFIGFDFWYGGRVNQPMLTALAVIFFAIWCAAVVWGFALLSHFEYSSGKALLHDALFMSAANLPISLVAIFLVIWVPAAILLLPAVVSGIMPVIVLLDGSVSALILCAMMRKPFERIEQEKFSHL